ncbi:hypothetical protein [Pseudomonas sp. NPDC089734]|uniref:hypothetical protein n=1 Tax=Pseudomonas sp. NPDC089734 TaxID=3364469 RepID=UPI0038136BD0
MDIERNTMNKNKRRHFHTWLPGILLTVSCHSFAQPENHQETSVSPARLGVGTQTVIRSSSTFLDDRIHQIHHQLENETSVHRYHFISRRGQDVLLTTLEHDGPDPLWKVEYQIEGQAWKARQYQGPEVIQGLSPGTRINIRVTANAGARFEKADYRMFFGSYPHMRYELRHEEGVLRIPDGLTTSAVLATQASTRALLDATFTDSKGHPVAGAVMDFRLLPHDGYKEIHRTFISDSLGKVSRFIEFNRCEGGERAGSFTDERTGRNTWSIRYKVGRYSASNALPGRLEDKPHEYAFGHLCRRTLVSGGH